MKKSKITLLPNGRQGFLTKITPITSFKSTNLCRARQRFSGG